MDERRESQDALLARLDERTRHLSEAADTLTEHGSVQSGRLARVETTLGGLGPILSSLQAAVDDLRRELRGGLDRAIGTAESAERRAVANAERLDGQAQRLDALAARVATVETDQRDGRTSRKTLLAAGSGVLLLGGVLNAFGVRDWLFDAARALLPHYDASVDEDGVGENDDDRPSVAGW